MVYTLSQIYSKENEKLMRDQNSDYKELRLYKARENRDFFQVKQNREQLKELCVSVVQLLPKVHFQNTEKQKNISN